jgi:glucose dehydrogenase
VAQVLRALEGNRMTSLGSWVASACARTARGARKSFSVVLVTAMFAAGVTAVAAAGPAGAAATRTAAHAATGSGPAGDETTAAQNNLRDGWDPNEPALTRSAMEGGQFGQVFKTPVDGQVYAQPLVVGNTVIVATENDWVYGLDAKTGGMQWKTSLGKAYHIPPART